MPRDDDNDDDDMPRKPNRRPRDDDDDDRSARSNRQPAKSSNTVLKVVLGVVGGLLLMSCVVVGGCIYTANRALNNLQKDLAADIEKNRVEQQTRVKTEAAMRLDATAFRNESIQNAQAAEAKYNFKVVELTGTIKEIGKDIVDYTIVTLAHDSDANNSGVRCSFDKNSKEPTSLKVGQKVTLRGTCARTLGGELVLEHCVIVKYSLSAWCLLNIRVGSSRRYLDQNFQRAFPMLTIL